MKFPLEIWQILANKEVDENLSKIAISLGIIRQICDDFDDYFPVHHEPFGDFLSHSNRLPEIIFKLWWWNVEEVEAFIIQGGYDEARNLVLSEKNKTRLYDYCYEEMAKVRSWKTSFGYSEMIEDFSRILR